MSRIIVVDDDPTFSGLLKTVLEFEGYDVTVEANPEALLSQVRQVKPTLVLMDVHSEEGDTLGVLREMRDDESLAGIAVVMTSGMDRSAECLDSGADAFILKPFRPDELIDLVSNTLVEKGGG